MDDHLQHYANEQQSKSLCSDAHKNEGGIAETICKLQRSSVWEKS